MSAAPAWQEVTFPTVAEAAAAFPQPPPENGAIHWAIWGGQQTKEHIRADVERLHATGTSVIMLNASRGLRPKYLSREYLDLVKFLVEECKRRNMKVWLEDDGGYPSGFAGGIISRDYPQLGMQAIVADARYSVVAGQTLALPLPADTLGILAYSRQTGSVIIPLPTDGKLRWTAPGPDGWTVLFVRHVYRSSPTRYTNRADGTNDKDGLYSLIDYLNPEATRTYLKSIHGAYEQVVGAEFGKTILGFRGDEPDYTGIMPWTPDLLATFQRIKGYDLQPYLPQFFEPELSPTAVRAKADYWDVWSGMFRDNFFRPQSEWCRARGMEYMVHLNHEETMLNLALGGDMIRNEGSFFRDMRYVDVPGVDNLNQIGPGTVADFPKLAASAAHVYGHPQVWNEEGGALLQKGKFVIDYNLVRGMNFLQIRGLNSPSDPTWLLPDPAAQTAGYVSRAGYLMAIGRPGSAVALYHPTDSMWAGDQAADRVTVKLVTELMEHQIEFDHVDLDGLCSVLTPAKGGLRNQSGQIYRAVIVPSSAFIAQKMLNVLRDFAAQGGKVIFVGPPPPEVVGRTFLQAKTERPDLSFAVLEPRAELTERVLSALPAPMATFDAPCPEIKLTSRALSDGRIVFLFNESMAPQSRTLSLTGAGVVQVWDASDGTTHELKGVTHSGDRSSLPLTLGPYEAKILVTGPVPSGQGAALPSVASAQTLAELGSDWTTETGPAELQPWAAGTPGALHQIVTYRRSFSAPAEPADGKRVYLDLGNVFEWAAVRLNGADLGVKSWPPYLWDVTGKVGAGNNALEIRVQIPAPAEPHYYGMRPRTSDGPPQPRGARELAPTGVPGGLSPDDPAVAGRARAPRTAGAPVSQGAPQAAEVPSLPGGLLGPVRLIRQ